MAEAQVRVLTGDEVPDAVRVVMHGMLSPIRDETVAAWAEQFDPARTHGAFDEGGTLAGTARWFPADISMPGAGRLPVGAVSAVAVLPTRRRRGHLRRMMRAQLEQIADEGRAVAVLVAAEWPIYGRYGYGPATSACGWVLDTSTATFLHPPEGTVVLTDAATVRANVERIHDAVLDRVAGSITRDAAFWDMASGVQPGPGDDGPSGKERFAAWHGPHGRIDGVLVYEVGDGWQHNRPRASTRVRLLLGTDPVAERELWRHLCELDWVATVEAGPRGVDDPLPLWLSDGRAARMVDLSDHIWARILDVPAALSARGAGADGSVTIEVADPNGWAGGRWRLEASGGALAVEPCDGEADVALGVGALGSALLGGWSMRRLAAAGLVSGEPDALDRLGAVLSTRLAPWCTTGF